MPALLQTDDRVRDLPQNFSQPSARRTAGRNTWSGRGLGTL